MNQGNVTATTLKPLIAGNVKLVPHTAEHFEQTVQWLNSASIRESFGITRSVSLESHREWLAAQNNFMILAILDLEGKHQGNISLQMAPRHRSAYLQIYIGNPSARGKRFGQNALLSVLEHAFESLKLHRIWLHTSPENKAAISLYRKAGFVEEGLEKESILRDGKFHDQIRWAILENQWRTSQIKGKS